MSAALGQRPLGQRPLGYSRASAGFVAATCIALALADINVASLDPWADLRRLLAGLVRPDFAAVVPLSIAYTVAFAVLGVGLGAGAGFLLAIPFARSRTVRLEPCTSQIGSGALPVETLPSACLAFRPPASVGRRGEGAWLKRLAAAFRALPLPVIGRVTEGALRLDLRTLEDEAAFLASLDALEPEQLAS